MERFKPRPYLITPKDAFEATYGKAVLLTDVMVAQLLAALKGAKEKATTSEGKAAIDLLWTKLFDTWDEDCPYEKDALDK